MFPENAGNFGISEKRKCCDPCMRYTHDNVLSGNLIGSLLESILSLPNLEMHARSLLVGHFEAKHDFVFFCFSEVVFISFLRKKDARDFRNSNG